MTADNSSTLRKWGGTMKGFVIGFGVFSLGAVSATWLSTHDVHGLLALSDNMVTGIAAGFLVLVYERWQQREIQKKLQTIRVMNHHVRNALQVLYYASSNLEHAEHASAVLSALKRIEWALREVLPGENADMTKSMFPDSGEPAA